jgi:hypothetical protein
MRMVLQDSDEVNELETGEAPVPPSRFQRALAAAAAAAAAAAPQQGSADVDAQHTTSPQMPEPSVVYSPERELPTTPQVGSSSFCADMRRPSQLLAQQASSICPGLSGPPCHVSQPLRRR